MLFFLFLLKLYWAYLNLRNYLFQHTKYKAATPWNNFVQLFCQYVWKSNKTYSSSLLLTADTFQDPHWMVESMDSTKPRMPETVYIYICVCVCVCVLIAHLCPCLCQTPMDCSLPDSSVQGILQARILEWVAIPFLRRSSQPRNLTQISWIAWFFTIWVTKELNIYI